MATFTCGMWLLVSTYGRLKAIHGWSLPSRLAPTGDTLASGSSSEVRLWDVDSGAQVQTLEEGHTWEVSSVTYSPDGKTLASGSWDGGIRLWDALTGEHIRTLDVARDWVNSLAYSPDGRTLASGGWFGTVRLWDPETGGQKLTFDGGYLYQQERSFV